MRTSDRNFAPPARHAQCLVTGRALEIPVLLVLHLHGLSKGLSLDRRPPGQKPAVLSGTLIGLAGKHAIIYRHKKRKDQDKKDRPAREPKRDQKNKSDRR